MGYFSYINAMLRKKWRGRVRRHNNKTVRLRHYERESVQEKWRDDKKYLLVLLSAVTPAAGDVEGQLSVAEESALLLFPWPSFRSLKAGDAGGA